MFSFLKTAAAAGAAAAQQAKAAQQQTIQIENLLPVNDDIAEVKYHHKYYGRDDAEETTA